MSLLVDLQLVPQRILEKVRAAVLQNREALRHGGIRSRVNQATKQRPQFTKVGATMRDYKAPVPVATGLPEADQALAWAYVMRRWNNLNPLSVNTIERGIKHTIYSANGSAQFDNDQEETYTSWSGSSVEQRGPFVWYDASGERREIPMAYHPYTGVGPTPGTAGNPYSGWNDQLIIDLAVDYSQQGEPYLPLAYCENTRTVAYNFNALPVGSGQALVQYSAQKVVIITSSYTVFSVFFAPYYIGNLGGISYHKVTTVSPVQSWSFLVGADYVKQITPSAALAEEVAMIEGFYQPGTYTFNEQQLNDPSQQAEPPPMSEDATQRGGFLAAPLVKYAAFGSESLNGNDYGISRTPGFYESFRQREQVNADFAAAMAADPESDDYKQISSYEYMDGLVPPWASRLRLVTTAHSTIVGTTAKWGGVKPTYSDDAMNPFDEQILQGENLEIWQPLIRSSQPPRPADDDFPQTIKDDYAADIASDPSYETDYEPEIYEAALTTHQVLDWGRPSYCRQQLIELLGFTEADLAPPTPTP
jgi:hypothetical protein